MLIVEMRKRYTAPALSAALARVAGFLGGATLAVTWPRYYKDICIADINSGKVTHSWSSKMGIVAVAFDPSGKRIAVAGVCDLDVYITCEVIPCSHRRLLGAWSWSELAYSLCGGYLMLHGANGRNEQQVSLFDAEAKHEIHSHNFLSSPQQDCSLLYKSFSCDADKFVYGNLHSHKVLDLHSGAICEYTRRFPPMMQGFSASISPLTLQHVTHVDKHGHLSIMQAVTIEKSTICSYCETLGSSGRRSNTWLSATALASAFSPTGELLALLCRHDLCFTVYLLKVLDALTFAAVSFVDTHLGGRVVCLHNEQKLQFDSKGQYLSCSPVGWGYTRLFRIKPFKEMSFTLLEDSRTTRAVLVGRLNLHSHLSFGPQCVDTL